VALARAALADGQAFDVLAELHDLAGEFVAGDERHGNGLLAQASQFQIWMSVPQMPVLLILISTSSGPISGTGRVSIQRPGSGFDLARTVISFGGGSFQDSRGFAGGGEGVERKVEVVSGQGRVHLGADAGLALGDDGEEEAATWTPRWSEVGGHGLCELGVAQHDRDDRVLAGQKGEACLLRAPRASRCALSVSFWRRSSAAFDDVEGNEGGAHDGRGQGVGEEIGPCALAQEVDHRLRSGDVAAQSAAKRLAEGAGEEIDLTPRSGGVPALSGRVKPVAWQSSTMTSAPYLSASARISGSFAYSRPSRTRRRWRSG
jgi:hypothetical protein